MHKQNDISATIQRIKCHAHDRDGAALNFSQDLKSLLLSHLYIYILFDRHPDKQRCDAATLF